MNRFGCHVVAPFYWQPTSNGLRGLGASSSVTGAEKGATTGASVGSYVPIIGTAVGAILGAVGGAIAGSINKTDPEQHNFDQAVAMWQVNPNSVFSIGNKYLPLAGLFDLKKVGGNIPIYRRYGRMGEQKFVNDLVSQVYNAAQNGRITANDTPLTIMANVVQPWIDSWGYGPMQDTHADLIQKLILGMVADYVAGNQRSWTAVGGDFPFSNLPPFKLPAAAAPVSPAPAPTPTINPVGSPAPTASGPTMAAPGTVLQGDTNASMQTPYGLFASGAGGDFTWQPPGSASVRQIALTPKHTGAGGTLNITWTGNQIVAKNLDGSVASFNPGTGSWAVVSPASTTTAPSVQVAPIPAVNPVGSAQPSPVPTTIPQTGASSPTVATTSSGQNVTQSDLQALIAQLAAQGQSAQQAYNSALQALQNQGVQSTPAVQSAVQGAIATTPAPASSPATAGVSSSSATGWAIALGVVAVAFATARPASNPRQRRKAARA